MKVTEHLEKGQDRTIVSFEILPPLKGQDIQSMYDMLDPLMEFQPPFINVTYHRAEYIYRNLGQDTFQKVFIRKRPGTVGICAAIKYRYNVDAVPHLTCGGFSQEATEDALIDLDYLGIDNVLLIRGDALKSESRFTHHPNGHMYASGLVDQVKNMNNGVYLEPDLSNARATNFCIGVGGYPEKHFEAPNGESDLKYLKAKVDAGADYIVTQMFFDNKVYFDFVKACRDIGITVPIIPGLKPIKSKKQISSIPRTFHVNFPSEFSNEILSTKTDEAARQVGREWCIQQAKELKEAGVPCLHFYTMGDSKTMVKIVGELV